MQVTELKVGMLEHSILNIHILFYAILKSWEYVHAHDGGSMLQ